LLKCSLNEEINRILDTLSSWEADIIKLYFGIEQSFGLTLEEIGDKFDLTRERVRQLKEKGIRKLKQKSRSKLLKSYLG
jgi:RNA polymerase primary sigma factor